MLVPANFNHIVPEKILPNSRERCCYVYPPLGASVYKGFMTETEVAAPLIFSDTTLVVDNQFDAHFDIVT
jgi:hypothetical protein